ncbi:MAG: zf-HC2 domain-containing protein [Bacteroidetes bacterium]|nr:zf-HC2 domain-containing protein [Bacteroidota bacterium]
MSAHADIQRQLYDYLMDGLSSGDKALVEEHLAQCGPCRKELEGLRQTVEHLPTYSTDPASLLPAAFWTEAVNEIDRRIAPRAHGRDRLQRLLDWLTMAIVPHRRLALGLLSLGIVAISAFVTWSVLRHGASSPAVAESTAPAGVSQPADTRMGSYLRKSRMLFVGVANMPVHEAALDLRAERETSRELVNEARVLKQEALDDRSVQLINDLEKIQIELANMEHRDELPTIALIRDGIERENLLFKIRIAETIRLQESYVQER